MVLKRFVKTSVDDYELNTIQENTSKVFDTITGVPLLDQNTVEVTLGSGDNLVSHGLGRPLIGWFIVGKTAAVDVFDKQADNKLPERTLILNASGTVTVKVICF